MAFLSRLLIVLPLCAALPLSAQTSDLSTATPAPTGQTIANGQNFGAWTVNCVAIAVGQTDCTLTQRVLRATDGAFVADVVATRNPEGETFLIARVPLGAYLPAGFAMREAENEDEEAVLQFSWQTCNREFCEALLKVEPDQVTALSAEDNAMIAAFRPTAQAEPFIFQMSLKGMAEGLDAVRP